MTVDINVNLPITLPKRTNAIHLIVINKFLTLTLIWVEKRSVETATIVEMHLVTSHSDSSCFAVAAFF